MGLTLKRYNMLTNIWENIITGEFNTPDVEFIVNALENNELFSVTPTPLQDIFLALFPLRVGR